MCPPLSSAPEIKSSASKSGGFAPNKQAVSHIVIQAIIVLQTV